MPTRHIRTPKTALALAATMALLPLQSALALSCTWNPATGNWGVAGNWSCAAVPGAGDAATIALGKLVTVDAAQSIFTLNNGGGVNIDAFLLTLSGSGATTNTGTINIGGPSTAALQVSAGHNINNTGGLINIGTGSVVNQFGSAISGGTIGGSGRLVPSGSGSNVLSNVTLNGVLDMATATGLEQVSNGLSLGGTININSGSDLVFQGTQTLSGNGQIVFGSGANNRMAVDGGGQTLTVGPNITVHGVNGSIGTGALANGSGNKLINQGLISADGGGTINIASLTAGLQNQGILRATGASSVLRFDSSIDNSAGQIQAQNGGVVLQNGVTVSGGTISTSGGGLYKVSNNGSNVLSAVTLAVGGIIDLASATSLVRSEGGMTLNGTINIDNSSDLVFNGTQTLSGTGQIVFGATGNNRVAVDGGGQTLTIGAGVTLRGENGNVGPGALFNGSNNAIVNSGTISADVAGGTITISSLGGGLTNNGLLEARNGGTLVLSSNITGNSGSQISAGTGSTVLQNGVTVSGIVNTSGNGSFRPTNNASNVLSGATFSGTLDMASAIAVEQVTGGLTLNGLVNINNSSDLVFNGTQTLSGTGQIVFGATGNNRVAVDGGGRTLTIGSGVTIRGENGNVGPGALSNGSNNSLVNNGTISADVAGGTITIGSLGGGVTNNGLLDASNGATLVLGSNINTGTGLISAGAGSTVLQNGVTIAGALTISGAGSFRPTNNANNLLSGVTFSGTLDMASATAVEQVSGGMTLNGLVNINSGSDLVFQGTQTLSGNGQIVFGSGANNRMAVDGGGQTLTVGPNITVHGVNGSIGTGALANGSGNKLINQGLISADGGGTINIASLTAGLQNQGILRATGASSVLRFDSSIDNSAGQIQAQNGGVVLQNGVTVSGGTISTSGGGLYKVSNNGSNVLSAVTLAVGGIIDLASATSLVRSEGGMTLNGTINIDNSSDLVFNGTQTLSGTGQIVFGATGNNRVAVDGGGQTLTIGAGVTLRGENGNVGPGALFNGSNNALINNGTINSDGGGTITLSSLTGGVTNHGTLRAQSGTLTSQHNLTGTGTLQVDAAGVMNLVNGGNSQGRLVMGAAGSTINIGTGNLTISADYTNAGAGSGNSFNRRAGISGSGQVVAAANAAQVITGANVSNGNTTNASLAIGNVRVNTPTPFSYQVANTGSTGPTLRGALQTSVNGANITDGRLSGSGVTPANYAATLGGNSGNLVVNFTTAIAGPLAALTGQVLNLRSNFENIADQKLNLVLGAGAAAFNAAGGRTTPSPVVVANQRTGGSNLAALTVANIAPAGAFSEDLNASFGSSTGNASTNGGSISGLLAGANNSTAMKASVDTTSAGAKSGTVIVNYQTAGAVNGVSNGLGTASAGNSGAINVTGNVYLVAQPSPSALPANFNLGNFHVGAGAQSQALLITNASVAPVGFQEGLAAVVSSPTGVATGSGFANAAAGNQGALNMGVSAINAGLNTGTLSVQLQSNGITTTGSNGLGSLNLGTAQTVTVNANGYRLAAPNTVAGVNFGNVLANSVQTRTLTISNNATADGFSEALNAAFGSFGGADATSFSGAGAISGLLAGISNNTNMVVTLNTSTTGTRTANVQILLASNGTAIGNGLGLTALPTQVINLDGVITANVGNLASAGLSPTAVNFGKFREGAATQVQQLTITNLTNGPGEGLNASFGAAGGGAANNGTSIASLATGTSNSTTMSVSLTGMATAGPKSGTQVLNFASDGSFNNNVITPLPSQSVDLSAQVYRLAVASGSSAVALSARRVGDAAATGSLSLSNTAAADGFSEGLRGTIGAAPSGFVVSGAASTALIAAGAAEARTVSLSTATAGSFGGNVNIALASDGAGTSNFSALGIGSKDVALSGKVYTPAAGQLANTTLNFGVVRVGDVVAARNIGVNNTAATTALNDTLTANLSGAASPFSSGGSTSGILAQGSGQIGVNLATTSAGVFNVNASVAFLSRNPDMADASAGPDAGVNILAQINNLANADFDLLSALGLLTQNGSDYVLDLGTINLGSNVNATLQLDNDVLGPADVLGGAFDQSAVNDFSLGGWNPFAGLAAGQATGNLTIGFLANALGAFDDLVVFNGRGTNASDPVGLAQTRRLIIRANVVDPNANPVPEPGSLALILAAALGALVARRRRAVH